MGPKCVLSVALLALSARAGVYVITPREGGDGIRRAIAAASGEGGGEVVLKSGVYRLDGTLSFKANRVKVRAAEKGGAVLSGAVPVVGWQKVEGKPWLKAKLSDVDYFRALVVNGRYAPRAEFPGGGRKLQNTNVWKVRWLSSIGNGWERQPTREEASTVFVKKDDIPATFDPASADVRVYHDWDDSLVRADKWFPDRLRLELKDPCRFPPGSFNRHGYVIYNTEEGMLEPGNWRFDAVECAVYYWPREGETAEYVKVEAPKVVKLVEFAESEGVEFDGIVFECSKPPMQRSTFSGVGIDAAVTGRRSRNCVFRDCAFRNCGGIALRMADCPRARLEGNVFERSGSCALQANGADLVLVGNRFLSSGHVFTSACALNLGGRNIRFLSNEIDGAPYCGVVFGGSGHLFESNAVRNVMQSLHDGAAFYGMGSQTVFRRNRVCDNLPAERARHAFYFDEGARDGVIAENYVEGGFRCCVLNHFAYNIVVSNNVFKTPGNQCISFSGSRWGTCVDNRFECGGAFEPMPSAHEVTNWAGNVFVENGVEKEVSLSARPAKADTKPVPAPYTKSAPGIDGWVEAVDWPGTWSHASAAADGTSLHGTPRMFRACHDGTNLYVAVRAPHYAWETPATNAAAGADWVRVRFAGGELELCADGAARASGLAPRRHYAGIEKSKRKGMGWAMTYQAALPLAELGVNENGARLVDFDVAIHDSLTGETRHLNPVCANGMPSKLRIEFAGLRAEVCGHERVERSIDLNGLWDFRFERGKSLEEVGDGGGRGATALPAFEANDKMTVPGCWNAYSHYFNQHGTGCYRRTFDLAVAVRDAFLVVDGAGLRSRFWVDGREIGFSKLPWSRFEFRTGPLVPGRHEIVAAVDSTVDNSKVKLFWDFYDFYPYGGFHHGVRLDVQVKPVELRRVVVRTRDYKTGLVELEAQFVGAGAPTNFSASVAFNDGAARDVAFKNRRATLNVPDFRLWSHDAPNLTRVAVAWNGSTARTRFGIRQVGTAKGRITLNGRPVYLKGVNRHESHYEFGVSTPVQLMYEDVRNLKDLGGNFIRGSHYAQCEAFLDLCDELGVLVWEESLGWGNGSRQLDDPEFCRLQEEETRLMVRNSINHPCVIVSAFLNEPDSTIPACRKLVDRLIGAIRAEDSGHLVTYACNRTLKDICHVQTDIIAYNTYPCWYSWEMDTGSSEEMRRNIRACHEEIVAYFRSLYRDDRPIIVSETGVKADYGVRDPRGRAQYTEDHQAEYERIMLEEMFAMKDIAGVAIWQFTDCKTYTRTRGARNRSYGVNTGGLYDLYHRPKLVVDEVRKLYSAKSEND